jgi:hypothetical protein
MVPLEGPIAGGVGAKLGEAWMSNTVSRLRRHRWVAVKVLVAGAVALAGEVVASPAANAVPTASLMPAQGQFTAVSAFKVLDTRSGLGTASTTPLVAGATVTFQVTGLGGVPSTGVSAVALNMNAISPSASGYLTDYSAAISDPNVSAVSYQAAQSANENDITATSTTGQITIANHSSGSVDVAVSVRGYFSSDGVSTAGGTYAGVPWSVLADTRGGQGGQAPSPGASGLGPTVAGQRRTSTGFPCHAALRSEYDPSPAPLSSVCRPGRSAEDGAEASRM